MRRTDIGIIAAIVVCACAFWLLPQFSPSPTELPKVGQIYLDGKLIVAVDLQKDTKPTLIGENGFAAYQVQDGKIAIVSADCPDQICVHTGFIGKSGQLIACVPNKLLVKIVALDEPNDPHELDTVLH